MSQLDWLAKWNTLHQPGYQWAKFHQEICDERLLLVGGFHVMLFPLRPKKSCLVFTNKATNRVLICHEKRLIKKAIRFGYPVRIESDVMKTLPGEYHQSH